MPLRLRTLLATTILASALAFPLRAGEPPRTTWAKVKCAVCHGGDGRGDTPQGKKLAVPDLHGEKTQKRSDDELARFIRQGHQRMPTIKLTDQQVGALLYFIRNLPK